MINNAKHFLYFWPVNNYSHSLGSWCGPRTFIIMRFKIGRDNKCSSQGFHVQHSVENNTLTFDL